MPAEKNALVLTQYRRHQSGQIGIIIILIMVVLLTVGLSLAAQSSREVTLSRQEEESTRTFNAAEAGVEQALSTDLSFAGTQLHPAPAVLNGANALVDYTITKVDVLETRLFQGVGAHVQLQDTNGNQTATQVRIDWSKENDCVTQQPATIIVSIYSVNKAVSPAAVAVRHQAYASCNRNDGVAVAATAGTSPYFKSVTIPVGATDVFMRVRPVYNDSAIKVTSAAGAALPVQYYSILSTATNQAGTESRAVQVNRTLAVEPSVMDFVVYSGGTLTQ